MIAAAPRHSPRVKSAPSLRDREIYRRVKVLCQTQRAVAEELNLSAGQVSRIVARVRAWRSTSRREELGEPDHDQQLRLDRWLAHERAEELFAQSMRLMAECEKPASNTRRGDRDGKEFSETTERDRSATRLQAIKTALKAATELHKLALEAPPQEPALTSNEEDTQRLVFSELMRMRRAAEEAGLVKRSRDVYWMVYDWMASFVGTRRSIGAPGTSGPGSAPWEVAEAMVRVSGEADAASFREMGAERMQSAECGTGDEAGADAVVETDVRTPYCVPSTEYEVPSTEYNVPGTEEASGPPTRSVREGVPQDAGPRNIAQLRSALRRMAAADSLSDIEFGTPDGTTTCADPAPVDPPDAPAGSAQEKPGKVAHEAELTGRRDARPTDLRRAGLLGEGADGDDDG